VSLFDENDVICRLEQRLRRFGYIKSNMSACDQAIENFAKHVGATERHIRAVLTRQEYADRPILKALRLRQVHTPPMYEEDN